MYQGTAYHEQGRFQDCLRMMSRIEDDYPSFFQTNPKPQQYIARSYAGMGQWTQAENEYRWLIDNYSISEEAFDAYLVIAAYYDENDEMEMAANWYRRAEEFYKQMAARYQGNTIEASAISYLAEIARRARNWSAAATYLESIFMKFPETDIGRRSLITAAGIYRSRMNRPEKADSLINLLKGELMPPDGGKNISVMTDDNK
jgi:tetratricopeptide (TPR) repeat protein